MGLGIFKVKAFSFQFLTLLFWFFDNFFILLELFFNFFLIDLEDGVGLFKSFVLVCELPVEFFKFESFLFVLRAGNIWLFQFPDQKLFIFSKGLVQILKLFQFLFHNHE